MLVKLYPPHVHPYSQSQVGGRENKKNGYLFYRTVLTEKHKIKSKNISPLKNVAKPIEKFSSSKINKACQEDNSRVLHGDS